MIRTILVTVAVSTLGCSASLSNPEQQHSHVTVTRLRAEPYSFMYYSPLLKAERLVIRDDAAWHVAWASLYSNAVPMPAPPNVDFTQEMVVFVALGQRPTGGYSILVDSAATGASGLTVWVGTVSPGVRCGTSQALTQPVDIARIARIDAAVHFVDVPKVIDCP